MNIKKIVIIVVVLLFVVLGVFLISSNKTTNTSKNPTKLNQEINNAQMPVTTTSSDVIVNIKNQIFNPTTLSIKTGTKVTWINNDNTTHSVKSDFSNLFDSKIIPPGESFSFTFDKEVSINYSCGIHPTMKGIIIVKK